MVNPNYAPLTRVQPGLALGKPSVLFALSLLGRRCDFLNFSCVFFVEISKNYSSLVTINLT